MGIGPVDYMIVAFPGNQFKGEIIPALKELTDSNTIRIIDLAFVIKDADGNAEALEVSDIDSEFGSAMSSILGNERGGLLNADDLAGAAEELEPNSSAALLVWENVWATKFKDALVNAGGELWDFERVPADVVQAAIDFAESN
jgi:Family of unknown function (DUF6325)